MAMTAEGFDNQKFYICDILLIVWFNIKIFELFVKSKNEKF